MKTLISHSLEETRIIAAAWLEKLASSHHGAVREGDSSATVVGMSGHLGAGKTAFVKMVAKELGIVEDITSPTFVIMKIYETAHPHWKRLVHIDAYRLEDAEQLAALRFESLAADPSALIMVEWPENVGIAASMHFEADEGAHKVQYEE